METLALSDLIEALTWSTESGCVTTWICSYDKELSQAFRECTSRLSDAEQILMASETLLPQQLQSLLRRPKVAYHLLHRRAIPSSNLKAVILEALIEQLSAPEYGVSTLPFLNVSASQTLHLDLESHFRFPSSGGDSNRLKIYEPREQSAARKTLLFAFAQLSECRSAHTFTLSFTHTVAMREELSRRSFASGSFSGYPGLTLLTNLQSDGVTSEDIVDALVHEAIHAALYLFEEICHPLLLDSMEGNQRAISPWTGNPLSLDSYVQACFVWYGLSYLWNDETLGKRLAGQHCLQLRERAIKGYRRHPVSRCLEKKAYRHVRPSVMEVLRSMESRILSEIR